MEKNVVLNLSNHNSLNKLDWILKLKAKNKKMLLVHNEIQVAFLFRFVGLLRAQKA